MIIIVVILEIFQSIATFLHNLFNSLNYAVKIKDSEEIQQPILK